MGLVDSLYILDSQDHLVFEHVVDPATPAFEYVIAQLEQAKRESASRKRVQYRQGDSDDAKSLFSEQSSSTLDPVVALDSNWQVSWNRVDGMTIVAVGSLEPEYMEVYSEDEEGDDDDEGEDEESGEEVEGKTEETPEQVEAELDEAVEEAFGDSVPASEKMPGDRPKTKSQIPYSTNPLQYAKFFKDFVEVLDRYLEIDRLTPSAIETYSHKIVMLLQEMVDPSYPYICDLNQLRELLPDNSIIKKITSTARQLQQTATSSIASMKQQQTTPYRPLPREASPPTATRKSSIFEKSGNEIPWRGTNLKYTQNEMFVDVIESVDLVIQAAKENGSALADVSARAALGSAYYDLSTVSSSKARSRSSKPALPLVASIQGKLEFKSSLSGMPKIQMFYDCSPHDLGVPTFHRCVDLPTWIANNHTLEFIPPDGKFTLMEYSINLLEEKSVNYWNYTGIVDADMTTGLGGNRDTFELKVNTKLSHSASSVENLKVDIFLPRDKNYSIKVLRISRGTLELKEPHRYEWIFDKQMPTGLTCTVRGQIIPEGDESSLEDDSIVASAVPASVPVIKPSFTKLSYKCRGSIPSGMSIKAVKVISGLGSKVKPYKGVKYTTLSGDYIVR